jgi:hypothetical protein
MGNPGTPGRAGSRLAVRPWPALLAGALVGVVAGLGLGCRLTPSRAAPAAFDRKMLERLQDESWYAVKIQGQRMGYAYVATRLRDEAGETLLVTTQRTVFQIEHLGQKLSADSAQTVTYGPDLRPRTYLLDSNQLGQKVGLQAEVRGDQLEVRTTRAGETTKQTLSLGKQFGGDVEITRRMIEGALKPGDTFTFQAFLPELGALDELTVTVKPQTDAQYEGHALRVLPVEETSKSLGFSTTAWVSPQGVALKMVVPGLLGGVVMERVSEREALAELSPLHLVNSIPVGASLPAANQVRRLVLRADATGSGVADLLPSDERQQVQPDAADPSMGQIVIASVAAPTPARALPIADQDLRPWLAATEFAETQDPKIAALSKQIVGSETDSWKAASALTMWVYDHMKKVKSEPAPITATQCLKQLSGDCSEHAVLLTALARAAGIPTKFCTGLVYVRGAFYYHAWNEVFVGKWVAVDPSWGELLVNATHLKVSEAALDPTSFARSCLATGRTMGALKLSVVEYAGPDGKVVKPEAADRRPR